MKVEIKVKRILVKPAKKAGKNVALYANEGCNFICGNTTNIKC